MNTELQRPAPKKRLAIILISASLLLAIPFIAMQFTEEVNWSPMDFLMAAFLLFGTGLLCEFVLRKVTKKSYRFLLCAVILIALILVWLELAVGIFGTSIAGS